MTLKELKNLGRLLTTFLAMFADCFVNAAGNQQRQTLIMER